MKIKTINDEKLSEFDYSYFIDLPLTAEDKRVFCELLDLRDNNNRVLMWPTVSRKLEDYYFYIENKTIRNNGKQMRVSYIRDELKGNICYNQL